MRQVSGIEVHFRKIGIRLPAIGIRLERFLKKPPRFFSAPGVQCPLGLRNRPLGR